MEERLTFTAELTTIGADMGLREMDDDELKTILEEETGIPTDCIKDVEVR